MRSDILVLFERWSWVRAIWEGGSAATGYLDEYSDLDLGMVVEDDRIEEAFLTLEGYLEDKYGIEHRMRLPEPTWHGHSQSFYFIGNCPPLFYIDFLVEKLSSADRLLETDRHGSACIWLNRDGVLAPAPSSPDELEKGGSGFLEIVRVCLPLVVTEVRKQIVRGKPIDAIAQHQRFVAGRLAGLLNLKYRPPMYDFGIRYAERAYPPEVSRRLEELLYIRCFGDLEPAFEKAVKWAEELLEELTGQP